MTRSAHSLNEKELGTLYAYCESPLILHRILEKSLGEEVQAKIDKQISELHDSLACQAPDDSLLSLALSGLIVSDRIARLYDQDDSLRILATEMRLESENIVAYLGRLRVDLDSYRLDISEEDIFGFMARVPDDLCVLASLYQEIQEGLKEHCQGFTQSVRILHYQAESQADVARNFIEGHMNPGKKEKPARLSTIPLPADLQPDTDSQKVVDFNLFRR